MREGLLVEWESPTMVSELCAGGIESGWNHSGGRGHLADREMGILNHRGECEVLGQVGRELLSAYYLCVCV